MADETFEAAPTNLEDDGLFTFDSDDHSENPPPDIVAFNELRSVT